MPIDPHDTAAIAQRVHGLRVLRGMTQAELSKRGHEEWGLGMQELTRMERGVLPLTRARRAALSSILGVDEAWLTYDLDALLKPT